MPRITIDLPDESVKELEAISIRENLCDKSNTISYLIEKYKRFRLFKPTDGVLG
jgi:metal-responsive CopG/Arc/MetJ family transcriptional regulator